MDAPTHTLQGDDREQIAESLENCLWMFRTMTRAADMSPKHITQATSALLEVCNQAYSMGVNEARATGGTA